MVFGSDRSRFIDINFVGKRYVFGVFIGKIRGVFIVISYY